MPPAARFAALALLAVSTSQAFAETHSFHYLNPQDFEAAKILPTPPAAGSALEKAEMAQLRALIASATPEQMAQARADDANETPTMFDGAIGLSLKDMPATWELLEIVREEAEAVVTPAKDYFARTRPWGVDPSLPNCHTGTTRKPVGSYPSGHTIVAYSMGTTLAALAPSKGAAILVRARDYALNREYCGVHFPSDIEASHVLGNEVAKRALMLPALHDKVEAAKAELAKALAAKS